MTESVLADRLSRLSPIQREQLRRMVAARTGAVAGPGSIPTADRTTGRVPMSDAQRRLHFLQSLDPDSAAYNIVEAIQLTGALDVDAVRRAVATITTRHEVLRTTCRDDAGEPELLVTEPEAIEARSHLEFLDVPDDAGSVLARIADRPFRLAEEFPLRVTLLRVADDNHVLVFVTHHIASDAWSSQQLVREFFHTYAAFAEGAPPDLPPLPVQYSDYAAWQRTVLDDDAVGTRLDHWREQLAGVPPVLELPMDRPRPEIRSDRGAEAHFVFDIDQSTRLRVAARDAAVTPFVFLLSAFGYVLHRHCATDDVVVGSPVAGRNHPDLEQLVGCFVNTVVLRLDLSTGSTCRELVQRVSETALDAYEHELPFDRLVADLNPDRDLSTTQLVQVMFNYHSAPAIGRVPAGLVAKRLDVSASAARFDLSCAVVEKAGSLRATLTYAAELFSPSHVARIGQHFVEVVEAMLADMDAPVASLPAVPAADVAALQPATTAAAPGRAEPFLSRLERHAATDPTWPAVRCRDEVLDYGELNARANRLAAHLLDIGTTPGDLVALLFERSLDCVVAMVAVQKAGATYVPLDPATPANHIAAVLAASAATLLLTHNEVDRAEVVALAPPSVEIVVLDEIGARPAAASKADPGREVVAAEAMYVVFTSGSTGRPKGVVVEHRQFTNYLTGILDRLAVADKLNFALVSTLAADLGLTNLYGALATGGTVHVLPYEWAVDPEQLADYFRRHRIDFLKLVPSHLQAINDAGLLAAVVPQRHLVLAGEACPWDLVEAVREVRPECSIWNNYGPTETTVAVLAYEVPATRPPNSGSTVPLGTAIDNVSVHVVDPQLRPVPIGAAGELLIAGASVARGYLHPEEPSEARFIRDPFAADPSARAYRSGDRGRLLPDGRFEFMGRLDRQTKIRGYRIEPGYVEAVLRSHPGTADAAVAVRPDMHGRACLVAYLVPDPTAGVGAVSPRDFVRATLPPYMVPAAYVELDRFPLTPNGKLDWRALPEPGPQTASGTAPSSPPRDALDERIATIWREVLGLPDIGIDDDFFAVGGDSFTAMRIARQIGDGLRVAAIFQHPTIRGLADLLGGTGPDGVGSGGLLVRLAGRASTGPTEATVVAVPFGGGTAAAFGDLARALPPNHPLYALDPPGHDYGDPTPLESFDMIAARCVTEIRENIDGPVVVYGHCVGAALAYDIATRLHADGADVVGVVYGGAFPAPRLPGKLFALWAKLLPSDRWRSDRLYRDTLRGIGGLNEDLEPDEQAFLLRAMRHDARQAEEVYTRHIHHSEPDRSLPALAVVGERDRLTEFHDERYREWDLLCAETELAVIPDAGHFFLKHQAAELASIVTGWIGRRRGAVATASPERPAAVASGPGSATMWGFALVTIGQLLSTIGTRALIFALGIWVYLETGSATQFSVILICGLLPALLVLPFAGAAADRWDRRLVMIVGDLIAASGSLLCLGLYAGGSLEVWHLYIAAALSSIAGSFQQPAYVAATAQLVPKRYLGRTNGVTQSMVAMSQALGPLAGGALIVLIGLGGVLLVDLVTAAVSVLTLLVVRFPDTLFRKREESIWKEIGGGMRYIARRRTFVAMIAFFLGFNLMFGFAVALVPPMVLSFASATDLSVASMLGAVGGIVGGLAMALWGGFERRATGMIGFILLTGAGMVLVGLRPSVPLLVVGLAAIAASLALLNGHWQTMIQVKVGMELQGRVLATNRMIANLTEPLGYFCAGVLADAFFEPAMQPGGWLSETVGGVLGTGPGRGMAFMIVALGLAQVAFAVIGLRWRTLHHMEDELPDAVPGAVVTWDRDALQDEADELLARQVPGEPRETTAAG